MKKVLLLALVLSSVNVVHADETPQEGEYETLTKVAVTAITIGAICTALYASKGNVMGALRSVRATTIDIPRPGFSKKALAFAGIAGLGAGLAAATAAGLMMVGKFYLMPPHMQLIGSAGVAEMLGRLDHRNLLLNMASSFQEMANMGGERGEFAHFVLNHMNFFYNPVSKDFPYPQKSTSKDLPYPQQSAHAQPPPVQRLLEDKS